MFSLVMMYYCLSMGSGAALVDEEYVSAYFFPTSKECSIGDFSYPAWHNRIDS